jgi:hypothetical protein
MLARPQLRSFPFQVQEAAIQVCGSAFYYRSRVKGVFLSAGVPATMYDRYDDPNQSKFLIARQIFADLDQKGEPGTAIQLRIVEELSLLRGPDPNAQDGRSGAAAIARLKKAIDEYHVVLSGERAAVAERARRQEIRMAAQASKAQRLAELRARYIALREGAAGTPQRRGYALEDLFGDLFQLYEIDHRRSYRTPTEQIDASFRFSGFSYLLEARWRKRPPDQGDLADLKRKLDTKLESVRGLFVSVAGFEPEVVNRFPWGGRTNVILWSGLDLALIFETWSFPEALEEKIRRAEQEGEIYYELSRGR